MANAVLTVQRYGFFDDDNADPDAVTQVGSEGTDGSPYVLDRTVGTAFAFHIRISMDETAGNSRTGTLQLRYQPNGTGGYNNVDSTSSYLRTYTGSQLTDFVTNTNLLTAGAGDWNNGVADEDDGSTGSFALVKNDYTECMWAVYLVTDDWNDDEYVEVELLAGGSFNVTNLATNPIKITVDKPAVTPEYPMFSDHPSAQNTLLRM